MGFFCKYMYSNYKTKLFLKCIYSSLHLPSNWSIEQFKPKAWLSRMKPGSGKIAFNTMSMNDHQGRRRTSLLVNMAPTTLSATNSGSRIGIILLWKFKKNKLFSLLLPSNHLNTGKHSSWDVVGADNCCLDVVRMSLHKHLGPESLVQANRCKLAGAIVNQLISPTMSCHARHVHNMSTLLLHHVWEKCLPNVKCILK